MIVHNMVQTTPEWWDARRAMPTASGFSNIISGAKAHRGVQPYSLKPTGSQSYICELIAEAASLSPNYFSEKGIVRSPDIERGRTVEPEARSWLQMHLGVDTRIEQVGFITNDDQTMGCSPDGVVIENGKVVACVEIKAPRLDIQAKYLLTPNEIPKDYLPQVHGQMLVTETDRCHFLAYSPGLAPLYVLVERNFYTERLGEVVKEFIEKYHEQLFAMFPGYKTVQEWRSWLQTAPSLDEFNAKLPTMGTIDYQVKERIKKLCGAHAHRAGWMWDNTRVGYVVRPTVPAPVEEEVPF